MGKNIVFCADGTWNNPYEDENAEHCIAPTNVYKLFLCLGGDLSPDTLRCADEQEKTLSEGTTVRQVAKYLHGVGDSRNPIIKLLGGAFGAGLISRIVRGYTFISRNYQPGDAIYIVGFSRGAYTARALAGLIASQGVLAPRLTQDPERAYRLGAAAWYRSRRQNPFSLAELVEVVADLPGFVSMSTLSDADLVPVERIAAVAVWDTVGAMGIPMYQGGKSMDAFRFADTRLSPKVAKGLHALALDEEREAFSPTFWDSAPNVVQVLFPGAHADVGGSYPMAQSESGLSDGALKWMLGELSAAELLLADGSPYPLAPDPAGTAHEPWSHAPWTMPCFPKGARSFVGVEGLALDPSINARIKAGMVVGEPGTTAAPYAPGNLP